MQNIPWIKDTDEAYDVSNYWLRIQSANGAAAHDYRLGDAVRPDRLYRYSDPTTYYRDTLQGNNIAGAVATIGADGLYGDPADVSNDGMGNKLTWRRFMHLGWPYVSATGTSWPTGLTQFELEGRANNLDPNFLGVKVSLWKRLSGDASDGNPAASVPVDGVKVAMLNNNTVKCICVDYTDNLQLVRPYGGTTARPGPSTSATYIGTYRRWDPMNAKLYLGTGGTTNPGLDANSNIYWANGGNLSSWTTLGRPNTGYPSGGLYNRRFEKTFQVMDGDLYSIGCLGQLMMKNCAQDGPLTWMSPNPQSGAPWNVWGSVFQSANMIDWNAKFDLYCPFTFETPAPGHYPTASQMNSINLHVLDMFTVWDPSCDGIDNDGDGAIDDADTGLQSGDRFGPEVRVSGKVDINMVSTAVLGALFPDGPVFRNSSQGYNGLLTKLWYLPQSGRSGARRPGTYVSDVYGTSYGPFETVGDLLRTDSISVNPGCWFCSGSWQPAVQNGTPQWTSEFPQTGITNYMVSPAPGDDDGDGIIDDRQERDMIFTWISNYITTRDNVFEVDINADICQPPYYPGSKLPFPVYKSSQSYARKQVVAILDRSTCLRVRSSDNRVDFTGPVEARLVRWTDDLITY